LFEKYGFDNLQIIEIEKHSTREECFRREAHFIKNSPCINKNIPLQPNSEWKRKNIISYRLYQKDYQTQYRRKQKEIKQNMQIMNT
jgi:hypothetical protein